MKASVARWLSPERDEGQEIDRDLGFGSWESQCTDDLLKLTYIYIIRKTISTAFMVKENIAILHI